VRARSVTTATTTLKPAAASQKTGCSLALWCQPAIKRRRQPRDSQSQQKLCRSLAHTHTHHGFAAAGPAQLPAVQGAHGWSTTHQPTTPDNQTLQSDPDEGPRQACGDEQKSLLSAAGVPRANGQALQRGTAQQAADESLRGLDGGQSAARLPPDDTRLFFQRRRHCLKLVQCCCAGATQDGNRPEPTTQNLCRPQAHTAALAAMC
jgi:hypothetical protein